jgi:hypothetical protein
MTTFADLLLRKSDQPGTNGYGGVGIRSGGRAFPMMGRPGPIGEVPVGFRALPNAILERLPWVNALCRGASKEDLFDACSASLNTIDAMYDEAALLMKELGNSGLPAKPTWMTDERLQKVLQKRLDGLGDRIPSFVFQPPKVLNLDLYQKPFDDIQARLQVVLGDCCHQLVRVMAETLDFMVDFEQVGLIEWTNADTCRFHYFQNVLLPCQRDEPAPEVPSGERDGNDSADVGNAITLRSARKVHELIAAQNFTLGGGSHIVRPQRLNALIQQVPLWMRSRLRLVTGKRTRRLLIEPTRAAETYVYRKKSALVCGMYVLAHWNEVEGESLALTKAKPLAISGKRAR